MLARIRKIAGDRLTEGYADIYAQWGDNARALDWLETAMHNRDPYLAYTKVKPFFDPLRNEPRFQAIERALKSPRLIGRICVCALRRARRQSRVPA
jgi:hypothetical protein